MTDNPYQTPNAAPDNTMLKCVGCPRMLHISATVCPECGANQRKRPYKSRTTAVVLAFFLGGFGAHRFYLGQWWGVFYLLFFWLWIPGIIAFIEMIVFLCTSTESWDRKHNEGRPRFGSDSGVSALVIVLVVFGGVALLGILAAIALPAYQDYTIRAKVSEPLAVSSRMKEDIVEFYSQQGSLPSSNSDLDMDDPLIVNANSEISISGNGSIVITFKGSAFDGDTLIVSPRIESDNNVYWSCDDGTLASKYRPPTCR